MADVGLQTCSSLCIFIIAESLNSDPPILLRLVRRLTATLYAEGSPSAEKVEMIAGYYERHPEWPAADLALRLTVALEDDRALMLGPLHDVI